MKRPVLIAASLLLLAAVSLRAQENRSLMLRQDFSKLRVEEHFPDSISAAERFAGTIGRQLTGHNFYNPPTYLFLRPAVRQLGFAGGLLATSDRVMRASKIGTADNKVPRGPFGIEEGPEAYLPTVASRFGSLGSGTGLPPVRKGQGRQSRPGTPDPSTQGQLTSPGTPDPSTQGQLTNPETPDTSTQSQLSNPGAPESAACGKPVGDDYDFAIYLIDNDLKLDALQLVSRSCYRQSDTLDFLRGWAHYNLKQLETANSYLLAVPQQSAFYEKSLFYSTAVSAHLGDYSSPLGRLQEYNGPYTELRDVQLAGLALLRGEKGAFKAASEGFGYSDFALESAERTLCDIYNERYEKRAKSPLLAAAASAVIPGAGKIYAGKIGEGVSAFLITGALGAITAEHWVKDGATNWKTIIPGLLTTVFYIGNIYGGYMSVSIYNSNLKNAQDTAVLYNIHIPLRTVFK